MSPTTPQKTEAKASITTFTPTVNPAGIPSTTYFSAMAKSYATQTGNSTRELFALAFPHITSLVPITPDSIIHDNAAGPGTATSVILEHLPPSALPTILVSDNVPAMVTAAQSSFANLPNPAAADKITVQNIDSLDLAAADIPDNHFTHSILNFSIFLMSGPLACLKEIYRTTQPGGLAAILTWRRFAPGEIVRAAQQVVKPGCKAMVIPREEFMQAGVVRGLVVEAGFGEEGVRVLRKRVVVRGEELRGLVEFMKGGLMRGAREGWSEEEEGRWGEAVDGVVMGEFERDGGVAFEGWVVLAVK